VRGAGAGNASIKKYTHFQASRNWDIETKDMKRLKTAEMKFIRRAEGIKLDPVEKKLAQYNEYG